MSKQAKEKKAAERLTQKTTIDEFQTPSIGSVDPLAIVGVVGVVGIVVYYKYFSGDKTEVKTETVKSEVKTEVETEKVDPPKRRKLDTLD